jgi:Dolichyl-phosphate-mannose-protein mannosyltransferase
MTFSRGKNHGLLSTAVAGQPPLAVAALAACLVLLVLKFLLIWRLNINWDEFFYLSQVHDLERGNLRLVLQALHTHLFRWLLLLGGHEIREIVAGRLVMTISLGVTILLVWRLAAQWASTEAAALAALAFAVMESTLRHGGSFRADSLLTPLVLASLLLFTRQRGVLRDVIAAGSLFGLAIAVTIKAALAAPLFLALALVGEFSPGLHRNRWLGSAAKRLLLFAIAGGIVASILTGAHWLALTAPPADTAGGFAVRAAQSTLIDVEFVPQARFLGRSLLSDFLTWGLVGAGAILAAVQKRGMPLVFVLALMPLLVYRNSFPYYYPVMLAPASVLTAVSFDFAGSWLHRNLGTAAASRILGGALAALLVVGLIHSAQLWRDEQQAQREVVAAVHQVFPDPVPYIDHSGMIASFPKSNFFMSQWGIRSYLRSGKPFMPTALANRRPAFILSNRPVLEPGRLAYRQLMPEDRELIEQAFVPFWGPIRVAGAQARLPEGGSIELRVPYPGLYRLESRETVLVGGQPRKSGDVIEIAGTTVRISRTAETTRRGALRVRLFVAIAQPPPASLPPTFPLYTRL